MTGYVYDGEGRRVGKGPISSFTCDMTTNGFHPTSEYIVGLGGEQLGETDGGYDLLHSNVFANGGLLATNTASTWYYALNDWLGTKRVEAKADGTVAASFLSLPFGDGLAQQGPGPDATEHHFTGKERDVESANDYFGARYYGSSMGRFLSPDPTLSSSHQEDPQTWNKYAYVRNNPLSLTDPNGQEEMKIVYRTFIPQPSINFVGRTYAGDNRSFSVASSASSRTTITILIETDPSIRPGNPIISQTSSAGQSMLLDANGNTHQQCDSHTRATACHWDSRCQRGCTDQH